MNRLSKGEIEFITRCLKESRPLPDNYRYVIPFEAKKEYELTNVVNIVQLGDLILSRY